MLFSNSPAVESDSVALLYTKLEFGDRDPFSFLLFLKYVFCSIFLNPIRFLNELGDFLSAVSAHSGSERRPVTKRTGCT